VFGPRTQYSKSMGKYPSIFQAEIHAIERCAQFSTDNGYRKQDIAILTDSQAAITALSSTIVSSKMVWECLGKLNAPGRNNKIALLWVPEHRGIEANEKANILTKNRAETPFTGPEPFCGLGDVTLQATVMM